MMYGLFQSFQSETKCFQAEKKKREEEVGLKSSSFFMGVKVFPAATGGWGGGGRCPSSGGRLRASSAKF